MRRSSSQSCARSSKSRLIKGAANWTRTHLRRRPRPRSCPRRRRYGTREPHPRQAAVVPALLRRHGQADRGICPGGRGYEGASFFGGQRSSAPSCFWRGSLFRCLSPWRCHSFFTRGSSRNDRSNSNLESVCGSIEKRLISARNLTLSSKSVMFLRMARTSVLLAVVALFYM